MRKITFRCPKESILLHDFKKCEKCKDKKNCENYKYEKEFVKNEEHR